MKLFVVHLAIVIYHIIALKEIAEMNFEKIPNKQLLEIKSLRSRYLTNWNFAMQTTIFFFYLLYDINRLFGNSVDRRIVLKKNLDFFFCSVIGPLSMFVAALFWAIYLYDRELVYPAVFDIAVSTWMNHALHTIILVNVLLHMCFDRQPSPKLHQSIYTLLAVMICYFTCLYVTHCERGYWVYVFLEKLTKPLRILTLLLLLVFSLFCGVLFHYANNLLYYSKFANLPTQNNIIMHLYYKIGKR